MTLRLKTWDVVQKFHIHYQYMIQRQQINRNDMSQHTHTCPILNVITTKSDALLLQMRQMINCYINCVHNNAVTTLLMRYADWNQHPQAAPSPDLTKHNHMRTGPVNNEGDSTFQHRSAASFTYHNGNSILHPSGGLWCHSSAVLAVSNADQVASYPITLPNNTCHKWLCKVAQSPAHTSDK